jgi:peptidoglycan biosynthesis protein MviN/MurJ (putative lipid II flippase)
VHLIRDVLHLPVPAIESGELALGAVGVTIASALAGWLECILLRRALRARIGATPIGAAFMARVWTAAVLSGVAGGAFGYFFAGPIRDLLPVLGGLHRIGAAVAVAGVFGVTYLVIAWLFGIDEVRKLRR